MEVNLNKLKPSPGSKKRKKRVGRGDGSGHGKTAGRGHKGHRARSGGGTRPGFEGGQMPLKRRVPKRGFHNPFQERPAVVNLAQIEAFASASEVTPAWLAERGLVKGRGRRVKVLGEGSLTKPLIVKAHAFSSRAREKIEASGGKAELLP